MTLATSILSYAGKEIGSMALQEMLNAYWYKEKETSVKKDLADLSVKIDGIGQDAAYLRIQPVKDKFLEKLDFYQNTFIPFINQQSKRDSLELDLVNEQYILISKYSIELRATIDQAVTVFNERIRTCDYPTRCLFEIIQSLIALRINYIHWQYFLMLKLFDNVKKSTIELVQQDYKTFFKTYSEFTQPKVNELLASRLEKTYFKRDSKTQIEKQGPRYVDVLVMASFEYKDNFSSAFSNDPYKGDSFYKSRKEELSWYDISFFEDAKKKAIADTYRDADKYEREYNQHKNDLINLHNIHVRDNALIFINKLALVQKELV